MAKMKYSYNIELSEYYTPEEIKKLFKSDRPQERRWFTSSGARKREEAKRRRELEAQMYARRMSPEQSKHQRTFYDGYLLYSKHYHSDSYAKNTIQKYDIFFEHHILPFFTKKEEKEKMLAMRAFDEEIQDQDISYKFNEINIVVTDEWKAYMKLQGATNSTVNEAIKIVKAMSTYLFQGEIIAKNTFEFTKKLHHRKKPTKCFTSRQAIRMIRRCKLKNRFKMAMILTLAFYTGMREGEILGLDVSNIDLDNNRIHVNDQYTRYELKDKLKTDCSRRVIKIDVAVSNEIRRYIKANNIKKGLLITNEKGKPLSCTNMMNRWFKPLLAEMKLNTEMTFHEIRHTYASIQLSSGVSYLFVSKQLGHATPDVTLKVYAHYIQEENMHELDIMSDKIKGYVEATNIFSIRRELIRRAAKKAA